MGFFRWTDELDVGVDAMNDEHKYLISLMNKLNQQHEAHKSKDELTLTLRDLVEYTERHFADEEKYMESVGFPGLRTHALIHKDLMEKLRRHQSDFMTSGVLEPIFFEFLKFWLSAHIRGIDKKYTAHSVGTQAMQNRKVVV